jgi:hypothetical protein
LLFASTYARSLEPGTLCVPGAPWFLSALLLVAAGTLALRA